MSWIVSPIMDKSINAGVDCVQYRYGRKRSIEEMRGRLQVNHSKIQLHVSAYNRAQIRDRNLDLDTWIRELQDLNDEKNKVLAHFEEKQQEPNMEETMVRFSFTKLILIPARKFRRVCKQIFENDPYLERLEAVVKKYNNVLPEVDTFDRLIESVKQEQQKLELEWWKKRETGGLPLNVLIGRDKEKAIIMNWLRKRTNEDPTPSASHTLYENISLLSIVGQGGMGKTTLAQHIYEDVKEGFDLKIWVWVPKGFDEKKLIAYVLDFLKKKSPRSESLAAFQGRLKAAVQSKRLLLVLDDSWEENMSKWENVLSPLAHGALECKILLTTQKDSAASAIAKVIKKKMELLRIKGLGKDVCLKLLTHVSAGEESLGAHTKLPDMASLIVTKLSGSPLATKIFGDALNSNLNESVWTKILNSPYVLNVEPESGRNNILPILRLSFTFPTHPLQNYCAFCGICSQDHGDDLVRMWIVFSFIPRSSIEGKALEDIGGRYFDVFVEKSFFDKFQDERIYNKMNDFLHKLAQSISSEECLRFEGDAASSFNIPNTIRHLFVKTENIEVLRMIKNAKNLHSLFLISERLTEEMILTEIFEAPRSIRLLFICSPSHPSSG